MDAQKVGREPQVHDKRRTVTSGCRGPAGSARMSASLWDLRVGCVGTGCRGSIGVPTLRSLLGLPFYVQGLVMDFGVNAGNAVVTNAGEGIVGAR